MIYDKVVLAAVHAFMECSNRFFFLYVHSPVCMYEWRSTAYHALLLAVPVQYHHHRSFRRLPHWPYTYRHTPGVWRQLPRLLVVTAPKLLIRHQDYSPRRRCPLKMLPESVYILCKFQYTLNKIYIWGWGVGGGEVT